MRRHLDHAVTALVVALCPDIGMAQDATLYRCIALDGSLSFQQTPCAAGQQAQAVPAREVPVTTMGDNIRALSERNARGEMSEDDLLRRLGPPTVVNTDVVGGLVRKQYVYRFATGRTQYYYSEDGVIIALQDRPGLPRREPQPCHTEDEIRKWDLRGSSIALPPEEAQAARERARAMRACRH